MLNAFVRRWLGGNLAKSTISRVSKRRADQYIRGDVFRPKLVIPISESSTTSRNADLESQSWTSPSEYSGLSASDTDDQECNRYSGLLDALAASFSSLLSMSLPGDKRLSVLDSYGERDGNDSDDSCMHSDSAADESPPDGHEVALSIALAPNAYQTQSTRLHDQFGLATTCENRW